VSALAAHVPISRLSRATLSKVPAELTPSFDLAGLRPRIVHLGIGAFHRAHQAAFTQAAVANAGGEWGICGVTQRSSTVRDQLAPQDCLFSVLVHGGSQSTAQVVGVLTEVLCGPEDPGAVVARLAMHETEVVTLTVTEQGYRYDPATGNLRLEDPELAADLQGRPPRTTVGQLVGGLDARRRTGAGPLTVLCCDNLARNGRMLRSLVEQFALRRPGGAALGEWIDAHARFPCTMVDRIVPATTDADRQTAARLLCAYDEGVVVAEPFSQWVIEDDFAAARPAWERAGVQLVGDVRPHQRAKVRLLNGAHSTLAYLGQLAGYELVWEVLAAGSPIEGVLRRLMGEDVLPTLDAVPGLDLEAYQEEVLRRFANPALDHRTAQIATDGTYKLPERLLGTIADRRAAGAEPRAAALGVAAWMRCLADRRADDGRPLHVADPLAKPVAERMTGATPAAEVVQVILSFGQVFGGDLAGDEQLRALLVEHLERLRRDGAERTAARVAEGG